MDDTRRRAILAELLEEVQAPLLAEHEFTIKDFAELSRLTYEGARHNLERLVKEARLQTGQRYDERVHRTVNAYWRTETMDEGPDDGG